MYIVDTYNSIIQAQQLNVEQKSTGLPAILRTILDHHDQPKVLSKNLSLVNWKAMLLYLLPFDPTCLKQVVVCC